MAVAPFRAEPSAIEGLWFLDMKAIDDDRGVVRELFRASAMEEAGIAVGGPWQQVNVTETRQGVIRGLHGEEMHKLVAIASGEAFGAYLDVRSGSPTYGTVVTRALVPGAQVLVPPGVCNGFQSVSPGVSQYVYCFDREWAPDLPGVAVHPLDPALAIPWPLPVGPSALSAKDAALPAFADLR